MTQEKLIESANTVNRVKSYLLDLQNRITWMLEAQAEGARFIEDAWQHGTGGGGLTRTLTSESIIEKAGVNFSHVYGPSLPKAATDKRPELRGAAFQALGVSTVVHPVNPYVPTSHMNVRFILVESESVSRWWFGGGFDLTPYYGFQEDCQHWHATAKSACDPFGTDLYPKYKKWCDDYFFLKHRNEPRGIGGIFFDDVTGKDFAHQFQFLQSVGTAYIDAYQPIIERRKHHPFTEDERAFQTYRRGRYVEFNLLYDRGTLFGLQSKGRTESILMSLPPKVSWIYNWQPEPHTKEATLYQDFLKPRDWI